MRSKHRRLVTFSLAALTGLAGLSLHAAPPSQRSLKEDIAQIVDGDSDELIAASARLRALGQPAVDALVAHRKTVVRSANASDDGATDTIDALIARVSGQFNGHTSGLFWHTDIEQAKAEALKRGVPIVSLRLLGRLDEDLSCANSRFFRAVLYANRSIRQRLRDRFVLHWKPVVDKAPQVTITFADGRRIERTITGNSMHWLLDAKGRPVDALPGLHGPRAFSAWLDVTGPIAREVLALRGAQRQRRLSAFHRAEIAKTEARWSAELRDLGVELGGTEPTRSELVAATTPERREQLAQRRRHPGDLDSNTQELIAAQSPSAPAQVPAREAARLAVTKMVAEAPLLAAASNLTDTMALDEVQNAYLFHPTIRGWLAAAAPVTTKAVTDKIYAELFRTPLTDPYLGLAPADVFSAVGLGRTRMAQRTP